MKKLFKAKYSLNTVPSCVAEFSLVEPCSAWFRNKRLQTQRQNWDKQNIKSRVQTCYDYDESLARTKNVCIDFNPISFPKSFQEDYQHLYEPTREFLLELQKSTMATIMASSVTHCLFCISEMLSFFICIFLLRHWLQFDLFRDSLWASEAAVFHHGINNNKVMPEKLKSLKSKRFWKRKNRSRSPDRSVSRCVSSECFTSSEDNISSISIDDVSSDITTESENNLADESDLEIDEILEYQGCVLTRFLFGDIFFDHYSIFLPYNL